MNGDVDHGLRLDSCVVPIQSSGFRQRDRSTVGRGVFTTVCSGSSIDEDDDGDEDCETEVIAVGCDDSVEEGEEVLGEAFACADLDDDTVALIDECLAEFSQLECMDSEDIDGLGVRGMAEVCAEAMGWDRREHARGVKRSRAS